MPSLLSPTITRALGDARRRGLEFLEGTVRSDGAWPSTLIKVEGKTKEEHSPCTAALGLLSLESCDLPQVESLRSRTRDYVARIAIYPGVWRYWDHLPPDLDDTVLCSLVSDRHIWIFLGMNVECILSFRDQEGRFRTWMVEADKDLDNLNSVDSVVNANVVAYLGDHAETRSAQRWLERLVMDGREADTLVFYPECMDLYVAMARASRLAAPAFQRLCPTLAERISAGLDVRRKSIDVMRLAQGVTALDVLGEAKGAGILEGAADRIVQEQDAGGGWPGCKAWRSGPKRLIEWRSEALTTASCIGAISCLLRR